MDGRIQIRAEAKGIEDMRARDWRQFSLLRNTTTLISASDSAGDETAKTPWR